MMPEEIYPLAKKLWDLCEDIPCRNYIGAPSIPSYVWYMDVRAVIDEIRKVSES